MALIKCKECGHEVSDKAPACPNCGCPIKSQKRINWKKPVFTIALVVIGLGCAYGIWQLINSKENVKDIEITDALIEAVHRYDYVSNFHEGLSLVAKNGKYGYINSNGEEVIPCKFDELGEFSEGLALVNIKGEIGFLNTKGEEVIPCKYDDYPLSFDGLYSFSDGLAAVIKNDNRGFINTKGEEVIPFKYDVAGEFSEGLAAVCKIDKKWACKWGFINTKGEEVIPLKYENVGSFSEGLAAVCKNDQWGFINRTGEEVIPCKYDWGYPFSEGLAAVLKNEKMGFINTKGEEIVPIKYDDPAIECGPLGSLFVSFSEGLAAVCKNDKWGFINTKGEEVIPLKYENVGSFSEGLAAVCKNDQWGFINRTGEEVIPCKYDWGSSFSEGLAEVCLGQGASIYGFVDKTGKDTFTESDFAKIEEYKKQQEEELRRQEEERIRREEELRRQEEENRRKGKEIIITMSADVSSNQLCNVYCNIGDVSFRWDQLISKRLKVSEGKVVVFKYAEVSCKGIGVDYVRIFVRGNNSRVYEALSCGEFPMMEGECFNTLIHTTYMNNNGHIEAKFHFREIDKDYY